MSEVLSQALGELGGLALWVMLVILLSAFCEKLTEAVKVFFLPEPVPTLQHLFGQSYDNLLNLTRVQLAGLYLAFRDRRFDSPLGQPARWFERRGSHSLGARFARWLAGPEEHLDPDLARELDAFVDSVRPMMLDVPPLPGEAVPLEPSPRLIRGLLQLDRSRSYHAARRKAGLRLVAFTASLIIAFAANLDLFQLVGLDQPAWRGCLATGVAGGIGSPFWHELLDQMTRVGQRVRDLVGGKTSGLL